MKVDGETVVIMGKDLDPEKVCEDVRKRSGKHVEIVTPSKKNERKENGEKKSSIKVGGKENKDGGEREDAKYGGGENMKTFSNAKKEEKQGDTLKEETFHGEKEEKQGDNEALMEYTYYPNPYYFVDHPRYFSDENPHACTIM